MFKRIDIYSCTYIASLLRAAIHTHMDALASECLYVRARTHARAHRRCRLAQPLHRIEARPSTSRTPAVARRRAERDAYIGQVSDRGGVPRADVRVERR